MKKLSQMFSSRFLIILGGLILITLLYFPFFRLKPSLPGFEVVDILTPLLCIIFVVYWRTFQDKRIFYLIGIFAAHILLTIWINSSHSQTKDYFEIYKLVKFGLIIGLFSLIPAQVLLEKWIRPLFIVLVAFNFIHFFELFGFNQILEKYYQAGERMVTFGFDSQGNPTYKRMLGFACNPNYNGVIFLFFSIYFIPKIRAKLNTTELIFFAVALTMVFLCQSRTALLSLIFVLLVYSLIIGRRGFKKILIVLLVTITSFGIASIITRLALGTEKLAAKELLEYNKINADSTLFGQTYMTDTTSLDTIQTLNNNAETYIESLADGSAFESYSIEHRLLIWKHMWGMIKKKPVFGHGPYKDYFYDNKLYSESEYFMVTWRYGFVGLFIFLSLFVMIFRTASRNLSSELGIILFLTTVVMVISSSTNNPFSHKTILVFYAMTIGLYINYRRTLNAKLATTSPLQICHISTVHKPTDNRVYYKECMSLRDAGYEVHLLLSNVNDEIKEGIHIHGIKRRKSRLGRILFTSLFKAPKAARKLNCQIYHFHDTELIPAGLYLKLIGKKVIYDVHENNPGAILSRPYIKSMFIKRILSFLVKRIEMIAAPRFDAIVTARPDISDLFKKHHPHTLRNFPILPNLNEIKQIEIQKEKPAIIYVGGMTEIRGIKELIAAFEFIDNAELWLLGPFGSETFEKECKAINGWEKVKAFGSVEAYEIFSYIKAADIGIVTFLPVPNHLTTLATKPFEYMACGLPMIMSDFEYWRNFFKDSAEYVDPTDSKAIAKCIQSLLADPTKMKAMSEKNLYLIQNEYNWDIEKNVLLKVYQKISTDLNTSSEHFSKFQTVE